MKSLLIGLTGGIGSGKTAVADMMAGWGARIVDADLIAHQVTAAGGAAIGALRAAFGDGILTPQGAMDRKAMRDLAFTDARAKAQLEAIVHPLVRQESARQVESGLAAGVPYVVQVIPLLVEHSTSAKRFDRVLVVDCPEEIQMARVMARNGLSAEEVRRIMAAQVSREARLAAADDVIDNNGTLEHLRDQAAALDRKYRTMALGRPDSTPYSG